MTGSLRHLGEDRWQVRYYAGLNPATGRQRERTRTFRAANGRAAKKEADTIRAAIRAELDGAKERHGTVGHLVDEWLADRRPTVSPTTLPNYERIAKAVDARFGRMPLHQLTSLDIERWYRDLAAGGMSAASVHKYHTVLRSMLSDGFRWRLVDRVETGRVRAPKVQRFEASPPTVLAAEAIIRSASGDLATALRFLALTGLRRGELCGLAWPDVTQDRITIARTAYDKPGGGVAIKHVPKGGKPRTIALSVGAVAVLADQWAWLEQAAAKLGTEPNPSGPIWADLRVDPRGRTPRRPGWLTLRWRQLCAKNHATGIRLHDLRHLHATTLLDEGVPLTAVSKRLGHSRTSTTSDIYGHGTDAGEAQAIAAIERAFTTNGDTP